MTAVYFVAFGIILGGAKGEPAYLAHLISGIFAFRFMSQAVNGSINQIVGNAKLVVNSRFPRLALPIAANLESLFGLLVGLGAFYLIVMPLNGIYPGMSLLLLPVALLLHIAFTFGASTLIARLAVPYRDVQNLVPHLMRIWLYLSPVLWTYDRIISLLGEGKAWAGLVEINPMFSFLSLYRTALARRTDRLGAPRCGRRVGDRRTRCGVSCRSSASTAIWPATCEHPRCAASVSATMIWRRTIDLGRAGRTDDCAATSFLRAHANGWYRECRTAPLSRSSLPSQWGADGPGTPRSRGNALVDCPRRRAPGAPFRANDWEYLSRALDVAFDWIERGARAPGAWDGGAPGHRAHRLAVCDGRSRARRPRLR